MPNLIHSLDVASLCIVINNYFKQEKFIVAQTHVNCNTNSTNKTEAISDNGGSISYQETRASDKQKNNINFYSIHDCFAVPCNKMSIIIELLKYAYIIIYSKKKYLLDLDANFLTSIKIYYEENAESLSEKDEILTNSTDTDIITVKYIPVRKIIALNLSYTQINVSDSSYLAH
jgi:hypothetical protein